MNVRPILAGILMLISLTLPACNMHKEEHVAEAHKIVATTPTSKSITITERYVCQIHSQRHVKVAAMEMGYLEAIDVKEGQAVKKDDVLFKVIPFIYKAKFDTEKAKLRYAEIEFENTQKLFKKKVVSDQDLLLVEAKLNEAKAKLELAEAELNFATIKAPFDGIIDRLLRQQGSLVQEGDVLTTLSDNSVMWVYFNVPEARYLEYMTHLNQNNDLKIELELANHNKFEKVGKIGAIEADFNNLTGNIPFRADFENPEIASDIPGRRLLRHGQTGTILISRLQNDAIIIPQRAVFPVLAKQYVYVIDEKNIAHQREIEIKDELEDLYVIKDGLTVNDKIVLEGGRQIRDGYTVEYEDRQPDQIVAKYHAE